MTPLGVCRGQLFDVQKDLQDDGIINASIKDSICEDKYGRKFFSKNEMNFRQKSFQDLEDWHGDDFKDAMVAFLSSCSLFENKEGIIKSQIFTLCSYKEYRPLCKIAKIYHQKGFDKIFFERYFSPFLIFDKSKQPGDGLFTGYYLWEIKASKTPNNQYWYPIYKKPQTGEVTKYTRKQINEGALRGKNLELLWCDNAYDVYSMQVQGSGIAYLDNGEIIRLGYDGKNDFKFKSYSEKVKEDPAFFANYCKDYPSIVDCLKQNHQAGLYATNHSDSFVFFKELAGEDIFGSQGVPLTQSRSIAIDPKYHPYGVPYFIETNIALLKNNNWLDFNRLWISQDTGSAIKGVSRADLYMGHGFKGEYIAKNMKFKGFMYILLPNFTIDRLCR